MTRLSKGKRVSGELRAQVRQSFVERYRAGESIRSLAADSGRSYGFVQGLLKDAGVSFRSRGGARLVKPVVSPPSAENAEGSAHPGDSPAPALAPDRPAKSGKSKKSKLGKKSKKAAKKQH